MGDQGAGGGLESHMSTHRRQDSGEEPIPTETAPETRAPSSDANAEALSPPPQDLPRGSRKLSQSASDRSTRVVNPPQALSRNPSTCSTSSNIIRPQAEYLPARTPQPEQRPLPPSSHSSFSNPPLEPPVTKATLSELDVQKIVHNPKLRHDINFDPELHFRPNLDGDKGKRKQEKANQFWNTLFEQLVIFVMDRETFHARYGHGDWCLPVLLRAVRDIIETLVPQRDRELLNEGLNVDLLMQQFNRGVADLEKLAAWLAGVLKLHCAPMRDEWVDDMYQELSHGNRANDMTELVKGMRSLLSVLEAMKLDVANHQIRCLRPVLIEDTVHFEQRFFVRKIESRKLSIAPSRMWYRAALENAERMYANAAAPMPHLHAFGEMAVFFDALSRLVLPSTCLKAIPPTFVFDEDRILKLRSDMHDSICLEICMRKYDELERLSRVTQFCPSHLHVPAYVRDEAATNNHNNRLSGDFNFMATGTTGTATSRPSSLAFSDRSSNFSSPRTSGNFFTSPSPPPGVTNSADARARAASELYSSLLALLQTAPPANSPAERWQGLAGPAALQILRSLPSHHYNHDSHTAASLLPGFERQLAAWLDDVHGDAFREAEAALQQRLLSDLAHRVAEYRNLSGVALFSVATGAGGQGQQQQQQRGAQGRQQQQQQQRTVVDANQARDPRDEAGIEDMAARLAHLGVLHWRVWAPLAYEGDVENELGGGVQPLMQQQQSVL